YLFKDRLHLFLVIRPFRTKISNVIGGSLSLSTELYPGQSGRFVTAAGRLQQQQKKTERFNYSAEHVLRISSKILSLRPAEALCTPRRNVYRSFSVRPKNR